MSAIGRVVVVLGPHHEVGGTGSDFLVAARTPVGLARRSAGDRADQVGLATELVTPMTGRAREHLTVGPVVGLAAILPGHIPSLGIATAVQWRGAGTCDGAWLGLPGTGVTPASGCHGVEAGTVLAATTETVILECCVVEPKVEP